MDDQGPWSTMIIWGSAFVSLVILVVAWIRAGARPGSRLGPVGWSFSQSWASNLTAVLVLFSTLFAVDHLPTDPMMPEVTYTLLSVMFGSMVIVAPILYLATGSQVKNHTDIQIQGRVWGFALAAFTTMWAIVGQLSMTFLLTLELAIYGLHGGISGTFIGLAASALIAASFHGARSVGFTLKELAAPTVEQMDLLALAQAPRWLMP